jgi:uncharacterized membrane protein
MKLVLDILALIPLSVFLINFYPSNLTGVQVQDTERKVCFYASAPSPTHTPTLTNLNAPLQNSEPITPFDQDPTGNTLAIFILLGMIFSLAGAAYIYPRIPELPLTHIITWLIPILSLIGLGLAGYLVFVEIAQVDVGNWLVGDCKTIQQSLHTRLSGILPVGLLEFFGYALILITWAIGQSNRLKIQNYACLAIWFMSSLGVIFSIYLSYLGSLVIGATCVWYLASSLLITALFWLSMPPLKWALYNLTQRRQF